MKITDLNLEKTKNRVKSSARIEWEEYDRSPQTIYFETDPHFSDAITCDPNSFVVASVIPALYFGERRLHIEEAICPQLKAGLIKAMNILHHWWYPPNRKIVSIEAKSTHFPPVDNRPKLSSFCFSGGVDSLATLYHNRLEIPKEHPGYLNDGLVVFGLEVQNIEQFQKVVKSLSRIAESSDLTFIPVYSNIIELGPKDYHELWFDFWEDQYESAAFAAIAHSFSSRWHSFCVNSDDDIRNLVPYGSHPLLPPCYSSWGLQIKEEGVHLSRIKKVQLIANWDVALKNLRVCNKDDLYQDGMLNCGKCEKCVRTMLALEASRALHRSMAFPVQTVTPELVNQAARLNESNIPFYEELLVPLNEAGRHDLASIVEQKIHQFYKKNKKEKLKKHFIEFDRKYFNGSIKKLKTQLNKGMGFLTA